MINPNNQNSNQQFLATQKSPSNNTPLSLHSTLSLSTNSFNLLLPSLLDSIFTLKVFLVHLDYLRVSGTVSKRKSFDKLKDFLFSGLDTKTINKPWHPHPKMSKSKKYQNRIVSKTGIVLGYTKRAKYKGRDTRCVYDIMIDLSGSYFADLSLVEQLNVINYLNSNWRLKCHRIDVAIDDYSREFFPVGQMIAAFLRGDIFGFQVIDDTHLDIIDNKLVGTLGIGSRRSQRYIRIYTRRKLFVRWETELKQEKAQKLFDTLFDLSKQKSSSDSMIEDTQEALINVAIGGIDIRDKSKISSLKNATKVRTKRLFSWTLCKTILLLSIKNQDFSNSQKAS